MIRKLCAMLGIMALAGGVCAEPLSSQPAKLMVSFAPGGTADILARGLAEAITQKTGQSLIVENRPGAGGAIAVGALTRSKPDGLTLLLHSTGAVISPYIQSKAPYDPDKAFDIVSPVASGPFVLLVSKDFPARNVKEFLEHARKRQGELNFGTGGVGSTGHLTGESLQQITGIKFSHVPFGGGNPAMTAAAGNQIEFVFEPIASSRPFVDGGRLLPLALTSADRSPIWPDVPTLDESGAKGMDVNIWYAVFLPQGAPKDVREYWSSALKSVLDDPAIQKWVHELGFTATPMDAAQAAAFLSGEQEKWRGIVKQAGVVLD